MVEITRCGDDHVVWRKALSIKIEYIVLLKGADCFFCPQNRFSESVVFPEILGEDFVDEVIRIVLVHFDLFQNHAFFAGNIFGGEHRVEYEIAQNIDRHRHVFVEYLYVEADGFFAGEGVNVSADGVHFARNLLCGAAGGPFKDHVLDKMRDAVAFGNFVARTALHPDTYGNRADMGHLFADHSQAIGQNFSPNITRLASWTFVCDGWHFSPD